MKEKLEKPRPAAPKAAGFWEGPLGYPQAILVVCTAFLIGLFYQWRMPHGVVVPPALAWGGGVAATAVLVVASLRWRESRLMAWLTGIPFAIVSTVAVALVAAVGAAVPAETLRARFGMASVYSSWPFAMVMLVMLANLIAVTARRCYPLSYRNLCFSLNHLGLTVALLGGAFSAASLERVRIVLEAGQPASMAETERGESIELPFTATLKEFTLDSFAPTLVVARLDETGADGGVKIIPGEALVAPGTAETIDSYAVTVLDYHPRAAPVAGAWRAVPSLRGAPPAARVRVTGPDGKASEGWVSCGGMVAMGGHSIPIEPASLDLGGDRVLGMPPPRPREFRSTVVFKEGEAEATREIRVNQPISVGAYRLYQVSYDESRGAASTVSILEAVRDPGLPVVYAGLYLMLAGAALLLWNGVGSGAKLSGPTLPPAPGGTGGTKGAGETKEGVSA